MAGLRYLLDLRFHHCGDVNRRHYTRDWNGIPGFALFKITTPISYQNEGLFISLVSMAAAPIRPCERAVPGRTQRFSRESVRPILCNVLLAISLWLDTLLL